MVSPTPHYPAIDPTLNTLEAIRHIAAEDGLLFKSEFENGAQVFALEIDPRDPNIDPHHVARAFAEFIGHKRASTYSVISTISGDRIEGGNPDAPYMVFSVSHERVGQNIVSYHDDTKVRDWDGAPKNLHPSYIPVNELPLDDHTTPISQIGFNTAEPHRLQALLESRDLKTVADVLTLVNLGRDPRTLYPFSHFQEESLTPTRLDALTELVAHYTPHLGQLGRNVLADMQAANPSQ